MSAPFKTNVGCPCGYNLRGLALPRRCPECGEPVRLLAGDQLWNCDPRWVRRLRLGAVLLIYHFLAYPLAVPLAWVAQLQWRAPFYKFAWILPPIVLTVAIWFLTTPDPRPRASRRVRDEALLLRKTAVLALVLEAIYWSVPILNHFLRLRWQAPLNRAEIAWAVAWVFMVTLLLRHLRRQFRRMRDPGAGVICTVALHAFASGIVMYNAWDVARFQFELDYATPLYHELRGLQGFGWVFLALGWVLALLLFLALWIELNHAVEGFDLTPSRARLAVLEDPRGMRIGQDLHDFYAMLRDRASSSAAAPSGT